MIALYIEDRSVIANDWCTWIVSFYFIRSLPFCIFCFLVPRFKLLFTVRILYPKISQGLFSYDSQVTLLYKSTKEFPYWEFKFFQISINQGASYNFTFICWCHACWNSKISSISIWKWLVPGVVIPTNRAGLGRQRRGFLCLIRTWARASC